MNRLLSAVCAGMLGATLGLAAIAPSSAMPVVQTATKANTSVEQVQYNGENRLRYKERRFNRHDRWDRRDRRDRWDRRHGDRPRYSDRRDRNRGSLGNNGTPEQRRIFRRSFGN